MRLGCAVSGCRITEALRHANDVTRQSYRFPSSREYHLSCVSFPVDVSHVSGRRVPKISRYVNDVTHRVMEFPVVSQMSRFCRVVSCLRVTNVYLACHVVSGLRFWYVKPVRCVTDVTCRDTNVTRNPLFQLTDMAFPFCHGCHASIDNFRSACHDTIVGLRMSSVNLFR